MKPINPKDLEWLEQFTPPHRATRSIPADVNKRLQRLGLTDGTHLTAEDKTLLGYTLTKRGWLRLPDKSHGR